MIKERICSYELSMLLQEKGFDEACTHLYYNDDLEFVNDNVYGHVLRNSSIANKDFITAPTHQMACDWLRIIHKIHIIIMPSHTEDNFFRYKIIHTPNPLDDITSTPEWFNDYGKAVEAACIHALNFLVRQSI